MPSWEKAAGNLTDWLIENRGAGSQALRNQSSVFSQIVSVEMLITVIFRLFPDLCSLSEDRQLSTQSRSQSRRLVDLALFAIKMFGH